MKAEFPLARSACLPGPSPHMALAQVDAAADEYASPKRGKVADLVGEGTRVLVVGEPTPGLLDALRN